MINLSNALLIPNLEEVIYIKPIKNVGEHIIEVRFKNNEKVSISYGNDTESFDHDINLLNRSAEVLEKDINLNVQMTEQKKAESKAKTTERKKKGV